MSVDVTTSFARTFVDELARAGVMHAVVAPGSRSTPLALALSADARITVHVVVDERSAGGFALGIGRATGVPAVLLCTSGTAAALFHGAVLEAHHGRVPMVVCTADRPPELRDVGAGQTIDQRDLYGGAVRWSHDPGPPEDRPGVGAEWRHLAARAVAAARTRPAGPVHLNLPFREPLVPTGDALVDAPPRPDGAPIVAVHDAPRVAEPATVAALVDVVRAHPRGALVAGWGADVEPAVATRFAAAAGWPVLADPISGLRSGPHAVSTYDAVLRAGDDEVRGLRPDLVLRIGAAPTSKVLGSWLADATTWLVDPDEVWLDPSRSANVRIGAGAGPLLTAAAEALERDGARGGSWLDGWRRLEAAARRALDEVCDGAADPFEGRVARDVVATIPDGGTLVVASSMPVRDVESFAAPRSGLRYLANRGVNGIDGFVGTVLGAAAARRDAPVVGLLGDLCFLHDQNALIGVGARDLDATLVVVDNDGGGIFSFLPQASSPEVDPDDFVSLFATPHGVDVARVAELHGLPCTDVEKGRDLEGALADSIAAGGVRIVHVRTDRDENVARHRAAWAAVGAAVAEVLG